jgi:hypothetical protein
VQSRMLEMIVEDRMAELRRFSVLHGHGHDRRTQLACTRDRIGALLVGAGLRLTASSLARSQEMAIARLRRDGWKIIPPTAPRQPSA